MLEVRSKTSVMVKRHGKGRRRKVFVESCDGRKIKNVKAEIKIDDKEYLIFMFLTYD